MLNARVFATAAALTLALASPVLAVPEQAPAQPTYATAFTPEYPAGAGAYTGVLKLTITPDGIVSGYFRNDDGGRFTDVTGGLEGGERIHLDFRWIGQVHVVGTFDGTKIVGSTIYDGRIYGFAATPEPTRN